MKWEADSDNAKFALSTVTTIKPPQTALGPFKMKLNHPISLVPTCIAVSPCGELAPQEDGVAVHIIPIGINSSSAVFFWVSSSDS
ncbi:hypothetical protein RHAB21_04527 [Pseudorhizobium halotolerans]|uniref:Uncharacterized protein n=1 Tax=Pseudorhizobium halotolerans TaxID=1233081 RepID=A0ABM8PXH7_9HYPH|nr:hypothetical protein RHAB21_04527 [Pseudorhizobium halotolerans]